jgi:hypothetical protein
MTTGAPADPAGEAKQQDEVMEREGLEEELMQEGRSEVGERIEDASEVVGDR